VPSSPDAVSRLRLRAQRAGHSVRDAGRLPARSAGR
jgi:hypothetical protein